MNSFKQFSTLLSRKPTPPPDKENNNGNNNNNNSPQREKDEKLQYDHLVFLVHGIGEHEEKWKTIVPKLLKCHKRVTNYMALNARVKWIPIEWHSVLHTQTDEHVVKVTPKGMTGPRNFINTTLIDVLFWASPYGQTIITEVGQQLNQMYSQFKKDHPDFSGSVSIYAHSLGSIICFDLLSNQPNAVPTPSDDTNDTNKTPVTSPRPARKENGNISTWQRLSAKEAPAESPLPGEPQLKYPQIEFEVENLFMLGSPTGIFLTARGADYPIRLPKCNNLYNIYNPNDPVAYLIEPLVDAGFMNLAPALVPHIPDTTEQFKGAVARGSKSLFSYYKNTTTTTTTTATSPSTSTTTTTTTSITKEVLPSSPPPSSAATSPSILAGEVVGDLLAIDDLTITESTVVETLGMETTGEPSLSPRPTRRDAEKDEDINNNHPLSPSWEVVVEKVEKSSISTTTNTTTNNGNLNRSAPTSPTPAPPPAAGNGNGANNTEKSNVFFEGVRYDYKLQPSGIVENLSEYAALINAHRGYWDSRDVMLFVLQKLYSV